MKTKLFIFLLTLAVGQTAAAGSCRNEALSARDKGINHLVVSFEGLASYWAGFVRKGLIYPMQKKYGQSFVSKNHSYGGVRSAENCIRDWKLVHGPSLVLTVIGHSFGAGIAVPNLLSEIKDIPVAHVITMDPRSWSTDWNYRRMRTLDLYTTPGNVDTHVNFYQLGGMRGYRYVGAENVQVFGSNHVGLPRVSKIHERVQCVVFNDCN